MDPYTTLRQQAKHRRDVAIAKARAEYQAALAEIDRLGRKLNATGRCTRYTAAMRNGSDFATMSTTRAAEIVLRACGPLTITEITIEIQRRGCRAGEDSRKVANAVRGALRYHSERFSRDGEGRWAVASGEESGGHL